MNLKNNEYNLHMTRIISPSLLASDFGNIEKECKMINQSQAGWIHCDVMDGVFVPNISFGIPVVAHIKKYAEKPLDVHLMIIDPDRYVTDFKKAGADILTVHYEACTHLHRTIQLIKKEGMQAGVSLNPHTPVHVLEDILHDLDMILIMSVNPGYGGQSFIENSYKKIRELRKMIDHQQLETLIQVDGGVDSSNARTLYDAGVNVLVAGSSVFRAPDPKKMIENLKNA